jgi:aminoglycoside phosphotransferase family enzyme
MSADSSAQSLKKHVGHHCSEKLTRWFVNLWFYFRRKIPFPAVWPIIQPYLVFFAYVLLHPQVLKHVKLYKMLRRLWHEELVYDIQRQITSPATLLFFTHSESTNKDICLKLWKRRKHGKYSTEDETRDIDHLIEGWQFNQRFAPTIYLGIAPVREVSEDGKSMRRGRLILMPTKRKLKQGVEYTLVMRQLPDKLRLDYLLFEGAFGTKAQIEFLAREVARMHGRLKKSPEDMGTFESIFAKSVLNTAVFYDALDQLAQNENVNIDMYRPLGGSLVLASNSPKAKECFEQRYNSGHVRRCHGDLKATNLWIDPEKPILWGLMKSPQRLLALDCVDFRPDFCHIDTLSDVALLAVDLELRLTNLLDEDAGSQLDMTSAKYFLSCYLDEVRQNNQDSWMLLAYYMLEKAMVCAYVSILFDKLPELGKKYLDIALIHAEHLEKLLGSHEPRAVSEDHLLETAANY